MAKRKNTAPKARPARSDLSATLRRFMTARCVLECAVRSLEEWHDSTTAVDDEATCLRHGLALIASVYDELDLAAMRARL